MLKNSHLRLAIDKSINLNSITQIEIYNAAFKQKLEVSHDPEMAREYAQNSVTAYVKSMPEPEPTLAQYKQFVDDLNAYILDDMRTAPSSETKYVHSKLQKFFKSVGDSEPSIIESFELKRDTLDPVDQVAVMVLKSIVISDSTYIERDIKSAYSYADEFMAERERRKQSKSE